MKQHKFILIAVALFGIMTQDCLGATSAGDYEPSKRRKIQQDHRLHACDIFCVLDIPKCIETIKTYQETPGEQPIRRVQIRRMLKYGLMVSHIHGTPLDIVFKRNSTYELYEDELRRSNIERDSR